MRGKLVVIEGADASGKRTQSELLVGRLRKEGYRPALFSFPRYNTFFGRLVKRYLRGCFGSLRSLRPELPALLFALDRLDAAPEIERALHSGRVVVADRYSASNIAYQAAKLSGKRQRDFIKWVAGVEGCLPLPDVSFYLDVPPRVSRRLMMGRGRERDLHERDFAYLKKVRLVYLRLARQRNWVRVNCASGGAILPAKEIHSMIWEKLQHYL